MDQAVFEALRTEALLSPESDLDLPAEERRARPDEVTPGTDRMWSDLRVTVLCPGRGAGQVCIGWVYPDGGRCIGTAALVDLAEISE